MATRNLTKEFLEKRARRKSSGTGVGGANPMHTTPSALLDDEGHLVPLYQKYGHWNIDREEAVGAILMLGVFDNVVLGQLTCVRVYAHAPQKNRKFYFGFHSNFTASIFTVSKIFPVS